LPVELIILSVNSASGLASVIPTTAGAIKFVAADNPALVPLQDFLSAETLNMKDLGDVIVNSGGVLNLR
jgi:predicted nicotinamide N-methyase